MEHSKKFNKATYDGEDRRPSRDTRGGEYSRGSSVERKLSANRFTGEHHKGYSMFNRSHSKGKRGNSSERNHDHSSERDREYSSEREHNHSPREYCRSDMACETGYNDGYNEDQHWKYHCKSCGVERKVSCGKCTQMVRPEKYCCNCGTFCQKASVKAVHKYEEKVSVTGPCGNTNTAKYTREESLKGMMHQHHTKETSLPDKAVKDYNKYADDSGFSRITKTSLAK